MQSNWYETLVNVLNRKWHFVRTKHFNMNGTHGHIANCEWGVVPAHPKKNLFSSFVLCAQPVQNEMNDVKALLLTGLGPGVHERKNPGESKWDTECFPIVNRLRGEVYTYAIIVDDNELPTEVIDAKELPDKTHRPSPNTVYSNFNDEDEEEGYEMVEKEC